MGSTAPTFRYTGQIEGTEYFDVTVKGSPAKKIRVKTIGVGPDSQTKSRTLTGFVDDSDGNEHPYVDVIEKAARRGGALTFEGKHEQDKYWSFTKVSAYEGPLESADQPSNHGSPPAQTRSGSYEPVDVERMLAFWAYGKVIEATVAGDDGSIDFSETSAIHAEARDLARGAQRLTAELKTPASDRSQPAGTSPSQNGNASDWASCTSHAEAGHQPDCAGCKAAARHAGNLASVK